jgi:hypothetical protein
VWGHVHLERGRYDPLEWRVRTDAVDASISLVLAGRAQVTKMLMISPTGKEVPIGQTLKPDEYIGMTRCNICEMSFQGSIELASLPPCYVFGCLLHIQGLIVYSYITELV